MTSFPAGLTAEKFNTEEARQLVRSLFEAGGLALYPASVCLSEDTIFFLARKGQEKLIGLLGEARDFDGREEIVSMGDEQVRLKLCPPGPGNLETLRQNLPFLRPRPLGLKLSIGMGDRLGLATPGHVRAARQGNMAPIFAQQSVRENARIGRTAQQVLDDATLGIFQEGWQAGFGADADHVKTTADLDIFIEAGYTFFTIDPSDQIDDRAYTATDTTVRTVFESLPWEELESSADDTLRAYVQAPLEYGKFHVRLSAEQVTRAGVKYGRAIALAKQLTRHLVSRLPADKYEVELSVDETDHPTSVAEHLYMASELRRLGIRLVSLAPRYVGRFEKGVDYIGDLAAFTSAFEQHMAIARSLGPYKLSLHSGSDKFTLYPIIAELAPEGMFHLKTAGTSYLEALRTIAGIRPDLFKQILERSHLRFEADRSTYHISAEREKAPDPEMVADDELPGLLDDFHTRQILHVTFGSILRNQELKSAMLRVLRSHENAYHEMVAEHFGNHMIAFVESQ